ncbi:cytochrome c biogenesis protein CcdA [Pannus brasiliensis CCIBt3594]|uniref:Cytochrome c biogenesis protein CcdA n=1 Tax=Pannus brasiliensis CCIBt3594 TaxID=1427578 RepID=A0AAW9QXJ0_9CHRO
MESSENAKSSPKSPIFRKSIQKFVFRFLVALLLVLLVSQFGRLSAPIEHGISFLENQYQQWFDRQNTSNPLVLIALAFLGGLLASVSPCILALLPVNLSYIGTLDITSRWQAFRKAAAFVAGTVTVLSLFGLLSSFATAILVDWKGFVHIAIGSIIILMGASFAGWIHLPLPKNSPSLPVNHPYTVGVGFALVSSPCASPILFAVLAAASASGSSLWSVLAMISYGFGYTAVIFAASLFTGVIKQSRFLLVHSDRVIRIGSAILLLAGVYYLVTGIGWFF